MKPIKTKLITIVSSLLLLTATIVVIFVTCFDGIFKSEGGEQSGDGPHGIATTYVDVSSLLTYDVVNDATNGDYAVVTGLSAKVSTVGKAAGEEYSLVIPKTTTIGGIEYPIKKIDTVIPNASGAPRAAWMKSEVDLIKRVIVYDTMEEIAYGSFNGFNGVEYMQLPFIGTRRGNTAAGIKADHSDGADSAFLSIFGHTSTQDSTVAFPAMSDYNFSEYEKLADANIPVNGLGKVEHGSNYDGTTPWFYESTTSSGGSLQWNTRYMCIPVYLKEVFITDETVIADRAFRYIPTIQKISINLRPLTQTTDIGAGMVGNRVFEACIGLQTVIMPNTITSYGEGLFCQCYYLETVNVGKKVADNEDITFCDVTKEKVAELPLDKIYSADLHINKNTFYKCSMLEEIVLPHNIVSIDEHAFDGCTSLQRVYPSTEAAPDKTENTCRLPEKLVTIKNQAFRNCTNLKKIYVPTNVQTIENLAFNNCTSLTDLTIPFIGKERGNTGVEESLFGYIFGKFGDLDEKESGKINYTVYQSTDGDPTPKVNSDGSFDVGCGTFYVPANLTNVVVTDETVVAPGAFMNCEKIQSLTILNPAKDGEASIMTIAEGSLGGCSGLTSLSIPFVGPKDATDAEIGSPSYGGGASTYQLGYIFGQYKYDNTSPIMQGEIFGTGATYYFPSKLETLALTRQTILPAESFYKTSMIKNIVIGKATQYAQRNVFTACTNLTELTIPFLGMRRGLYYENHYWWMDDAIRNSLIWLFANRTASEHYTNHYITDWTGRWAAYVPNAFKKLNVTDENYINTYGMRGFSTLTDINIESDDPTHMTIEEYAMYGDGSVESLIVPFIGRDWNSKAIDSRAYTVGWFFGESSYPNSYKAYQYDKTFYIPKNLQRISFGDTMTNISAGAFQNMSSLVSVHSDAHITQLGNYAFANCVLFNDLTLNNATYTYVGNYAFLNDIAVTRIYDFNPVTINQIGHGAFMGTSIYEVDLKKYSFLGDWAFANCLQLEKVDLTGAGTGVTSAGLSYLGKHLFDGCKHLYDVTLAPNLVSDYMLANCISLEDIDLDGITTVIPAGLFDGCENLQSLSVDTSTTPYTYHGLKLTPTTCGVTSIGEYAFRGCKSLTEFTLPETLQTINRGAFQNCIGLNFLRIPKTTTIMAYGNDLRKNPIEDYDNGIFWGCDRNKFYLEVYYPEEEWPSSWGNNWNCYFPVHIIQSENDNLFTYEYNAELKGYLITGLNQYNATTNPQGIDFAPNKQPLLHGNLVFPSTHDGLTVYGIKAEAFINATKVMIYDGSSNIYIHPLQMVENFILGATYIYLGKDALDFHEYDGNQFRGIYSQKTSAEARKITEYYSDPKKTQYDGEYGLHFENEGFYAYNSVVYYKEAWDFVGSRPTWNLNALIFKLQANYYTYDLGNQIKPKIVDIYPNTDVIKYPFTSAPGIDDITGLSNALIEAVLAGKEQIVNALYADPSDFNTAEGRYDSSVFNLQYKNNVNVGTGTIMIRSNDSLFTGSRDIPFEIRPYEIELFNPDGFDENTYGTDSGNKGDLALGAMDHYINLITMGEVISEAANKATFGDQFRKVEIKSEVYNGKPVAITSWTQGINAILPNQYTLRGRLETTSANSGYYAMGTWFDENNVIQKNMVLSNRLVGEYDALGHRYPNGSSQIDVVGGFKWVGKPVVRDPRGNDVSKNFTFVINYVVYIEPFSIPSSGKMMWPGQPDEPGTDNIYEYQFTGSPIVPVPVVYDKQNNVLDPKFVIGVSYGPNGVNGEPVDAIFPSEQIYTSYIKSYDHRNFVLEAGMDHIDFKIIKAKLKISMSLSRYVIGEDELNFSYDIANWASAPTNYNLKITGLQPNATIKGILQTSGWEKGWYKSINPVDGKSMNWKPNTFDIIIPDPMDSKNTISALPYYDVDDITKYLNTEVEIIYQTFDYNYTVSYLDNITKNTEVHVIDPTVNGGVNTGVGVNSFADSDTYTEIGYGLDGRTHVLDIRLNNVKNPASGSFQKSFTYNSASTSSFTFGETPGMVYEIQLIVTKDRFEPISKTIKLICQKGIYTFESLTKEYDREVVDPLSKLVRVPVDFDPSGMKFEYFMQTDFNFKNPLETGAPKEIGNYKFTADTLSIRTADNKPIHSPGEWFEELDVWPSKTSDKNQSNFSITKRKLYIDLVDDILPYESKVYDGKPWELMGDNIVKADMNLLPGDSLSGHFMSRSAEPGVYDGDTYGDIIVAAGTTWKVNNSALGVQTKYYEIVYRGKYEIQYREMEYSVQDYGPAVYDGRFHNIEVTVTEPSFGYKVYYSEYNLPDDSGEWSEYNFFYTEPGIYTVYFKIEAKYYHTVRGVATVTINGKDVDAYTSDKTVHYDGFVHSIEVNVIDPLGATILYAYSPNGTVNVDPEELSYSKICPTFTEIGDYHYYVKVESPNYTTWGPVPVCLTIDNNGPDTGIVVTGESTVYDGDFHGPIFDFTNAASGVTPASLDLYYYLGENSTTPNWINTTLSPLLDASGNPIPNKYTLPLFIDAQTDPYLINLQLRVRGYKLVEYPEVKVEIKPLALDLVINGWSGIFDNQYHTVTLSKGSTCYDLVVTGDINDTDPLNTQLVYKYYFTATDFVVLKVYYSATNPHGNIKAMQSDVLKYKDSSPTPYPIYVIATAENCAEVPLSAVVSIQFDDHPTYTIDNPFTIEYLARYIDNSDVDEYGNLETTHDGNRIYSYQSKLPDGSWSNYYISNPKDLGDYRVKIEFKRSKNCAQMITSWIEFSIVPRRLIISYEKELEYNGTYQMPTVYADPGNKVDTIEIKRTIVGGVDPINVGDYEMDISMLYANDNYYIDISDQRLPFKIINRKIYIEINEKMIYNGSPWKKEDGWTVKNILPSDTINISMETEDKSVDSYTRVGYYYYQGGNYISNFKDNSPAGIFAFDVIATQLEIKTPDGMGGFVDATYYDVCCDIHVDIVNPPLELELKDGIYDYDGNRHSIIKNILSAGVLRTTDTYWLVSNPNHTESMWTETEVGEYELGYRIKAVGYEDYTSDDHGTVKIIINKVNLAMEIEPFNKVYDGQEHQVDFKILNDNFKLPSIPKPDKYYFNVEEMKAKGITPAMLDQFFKDGKDPSFTKVYNYWKTVDTSIKNAGTYLAYVYFEDCNNWYRSFTSAEVTLKKRPLYFDYLGAGNTPNGDFVDSKFYDGDTYVIPMGDFLYDRNNPSGNTQPDKGLVSGHVINDSKMSNFSFQTFEPDCRGEANNVGYEDPYGTFDGDFSFKNMVILSGGGENVADNYYPIINDNKVKITIKRIDLTKFVVLDQTMQYNGKNALPEIQTPSDGKILSYYYWVDGTKQRLLPDTLRTDQKDVTLFNGNVDGYYEVYVTILAGRNYYEWKGGSTGTDFATDAQVNAADPTHYYKKAYVKVIPYETDVLWEELSHTYDATDHYAKPYILDVNGVKRVLDYELYDDKGVKQVSTVLRYAGNYGVIAYIPGSSILNEKNYTLGNPQNGYTVLPKVYTITENVNEPYLNTNWTKEYTEADFNDPGHGVEWMPDHTIEKLLIATRENGAGTYNRTHQFEVTKKILDKDGNDVSKCFEFDLNLYVNLRSSDIIFDTEFVDVLYDNNKHAPKINVKSHAAGNYSFSYIVLPVQDDGTYFNDMDPTNGYVLPPYEHADVFPTFTDVGRYRVFFRISVGGTDAASNMKEGYTDVRIRQNQSELSVGAPGLNKVYDGKGYSVQEVKNMLSGKYNGGTNGKDYFEFHWYRLGDPTELGTAPINVGEYTLRVTSTADGAADIPQNYTPLDFSVNFKITPAELLIIANDDWEIDDNILATQHWSHQGDMPTNVVDSTKKYQLTGLQGSDELHFTISENVGLKRTTYTYLTGNAYASDFKFIVDSKEFEVVWNVDYKESSTSTLDKTMNYVLRLDFNLYVHYPFIKANIEDKSYDYDGTPKTLVGVGKNIEVTYPTSGLTYEFGEVKGTYTHTGENSYSQTNPGIYTVYYKISCPDFEDLIGVTNLTIKYQDRTPFLNIPDISKTYDNIAYGTSDLDKQLDHYGTGNKLGWKPAGDLPAGIVTEALPSVSTWKIEYYEAVQEEVNGVKVWKKSGLAKDSVIDAGEYIYVLTIPKGAVLYGETVIENHFRIAEKTYYVSSTNPINKPYDGLRWTYDLATNIDGYTIDTLCAGHKITKATLRTTDNKCETYSKSSASCYIEIAYDEGTDYIIVDTLNGNREVTKNYSIVIDLTVEIQLGTMTVTTNIPSPNPNFSYPGEGNYVTPVAILTNPSNYQSYVEYYSNELGAWTKTAPSYRDVKDGYQMQVRILNVPNYQDFYGTYTFNIKKQANTLNIRPLDKVYDGSQITAPVIDTSDYHGQATTAMVPGIVVTWLDASGSTLPGNVAPTNVGDYKVRVKYPDTANYTGKEEEIEFKITPLQIALVWDKTMLPYNGVQQSPDFNITNSVYPGLAIKNKLSEGTDYTLTYSTQAAIGSAIAMPKNVGAYHIEFKLIGQSANNYKFDISLNDIDDTHDFEITPCEITITVATTVKQTGSNISIPLNDITVTGLPATMSYQSLIKTKSALAGVYTAKGLYDCNDFVTKFEFSPGVIYNSTNAPKIVMGGVDEDMSNFKVSVDISVVVSADSLPYTIKGYEGIYDGQEHSIELSLNVPADDIIAVEYRVGESGEFKPELPMFKDAMSSPAHIYVRVKSKTYNPGNWNYLAQTSADSNFKQFEVKIDKVDSSIALTPDFAGLDKVYDAKSVEKPKVDYNAVEGEDLSEYISYQFFIWDDKSSYRPIDIVSCKVVGQYKVVISMNPSTNYTGTTAAGNIEHEFKITPREVVITLHDQHKVYDGKLWSGIISSMASTPGRIPEAKFEKVSGITESGLVPGHNFTATVQTALPDAGFYKLADKDFTWKSQYSILDSSNGDEPVTNNYIVTLDFEVTIDEAEFDIESSDGIGVYDGVTYYYIHVDFKTDPIVEEPNLENLIFYREKPEDTWSNTNILKLSGIHNVYFMVKAPNYKTYYGMQQIKVSPINSTITVADYPGRVKDLVYNGKPYDETLIQSHLNIGTDRTVTYTFYNAVTKEKLPGAPTNVGQYYFEASVAASATASAQTSGPYAFKITPYELTVEWTADDVKVAQDGTKSYKMAYTGSICHPTPSVKAIWDAGTPEIPLIITITNPTNGQAIIAGDYYTVKAEIKYDADTTKFSQNYTLKNDTINYSITRQIGGVIPGDPDNPPIPGLPDPSDPNYSGVTFPDQGDYDNNNDPYTYGDTIRIQMVTNNSSGVATTYVLDLKQQGTTTTYDVVGISDGTNSATFDANNSCNFTIDLPAQTCPYIIATAKLKDKVNMAWDTAGDYSDKQFKIFINPKELSPTPADPTDPDSVADVIIYKDLLKSSHKYTGKPITFPVTVALTNGTADRSDDTILTEGVHYKILWFDNTDVTGETVEDLASFNIESLDAGGYKFAFGKTETPTNQKSNDAFTFEIVTDAPSRIKLKPGSIIQFVEIKQDFKTHLIDVNVLNYNERCNILDALSVADQAAYPIRLGHTYQGLTVAEILNDISNDSDLMKVYAADGTVIHDMISATTVDKSAEKIITTGMKFELFKDKTSATPVDIIELILLGDVNADGYINNNDATEVFNTVKKGKGSTDSLYQAGLINAITKGALKAEITNNDATSIFNHVKNSKTDSKQDINNDYKPKSE